MAIGTGAGDFHTGGVVESGKQFQQDSLSTINPLHVEQYGGVVEKQIVKSSFMRQFVNIKSVKGTDVITNNRMGKTSLQAVRKGIRPEGNGVDFDNVSVKVDTVILARNQVALLDDFQASFDVRKEVGEDHGKEIGKFFDEAFIIQGIKASLINAVDADGSPVAGQIAQRQPDGWGTGNTIDLASEGDDLDPDKLELAIQDMVESIETQDVDIEGGVLLVSPKHYNVLLRNEKLISADYSNGNGDYSKGVVLKAMGLRIMKTNRIPKATITGHKLSNDGNGNAYDVSADEAKCVALYVQPKTFLAGETIGLTSKVYYVDQELQYFIDSYLAFGVTPNRPEYTGMVRKA